MHNNKTKILYIAGNGRSGSTLLGIILGQLDGFFAAGELRRIWDRGLIENRPCGCGMSFRDCQTWRTIFHEAYGGMDAVDFKAMVNYRERMTQTKHLISMINEKNVSLCMSTDMKIFLENLDKLYKSIHSVSGCNVIVDASKWPTYGYILAMLPSVEWYVLHLVRDPRAVAFSWTRKKYFEQDRLMPRQSALKSTLYWLVWNPAITYLWDRSDIHYMRLTYEDFIKNPYESVAQIISFVGKDEQELPFIDSATVQISKSHSVAGNSVRLASGPIALKIDDEWKKKLSLATKNLVATLTFPLLCKYGYRLSTRL